MDNKESFDFNFDETYEQVIAEMQQKEKDDFEDILSDSSYSIGKHDVIDISSSSQKKSFKIWWKNLKKGKKALLISATSIVLVIAIALGWFFTFFKYNYKSITTDPDELGFDDVKQHGVINVALFGVDSRDETVFKGNTDSIMILSLNTNTKKVKIFSVMRDTFVPMEFEGKKYHGKINSAYSKGPEHAIKTLNQAFDLDISEYATVNFFGMADIIDAVGGITANITKDELTWKGFDHPNLNNCMDEICSEMGLSAKDYYIHTDGEQTLNGVQAVAYARVRHCTSIWGTRDDFGRTDRQRHVMQELFNKAITMKKTQYVSLAKALIPCSETSLSYADIVGLATNILLSSPTFEQYRLPPADYQSEFLMTSPSGYGSVIYYDLGYTAEMINSIIYDDVTMEQFITENPVRRDNWYYKTSSSGSSSGATSNKTQQSQTVSNQNQQNSVEQPEESTPSKSEESTTSTPSEPEEPTPSKPEEPEESKEPTSSTPEESKESTTSTPSEPEEPEESTPSKPEEPTPSEPDESKDSSTSTEVGDSTD